MPEPTIAGYARNALLDARAALDAFLGDAEQVARIERLAGTIARAFREGRKVLICGNGGSLADATHFAEELTGRFRKDRPALPAIAIADPGHITCTANDYGYEHVFSRGIEALGQRGDVLIVLSTSGNSANVVKAVEAGKARGLITSALLGKDGGVLKGRCELEIIAPGATADRIQEIHMLVLHTVVQGIELEMGYAK